MRRSRADSPRKRVSASIGRGSFGWRAALVMRLLSGGRTRASARSVPPTTKRDHGFRCRKVVTLAPERPLPGHSDPPFALAVPGREIPRMPTPSLNRALLLAGLALLSACGRPAAGSKRNLVLATTTSAQDSGILDSLVPLFERDSGITVKVIAVGTGAALDLGARG